MAGKYIVMLAPGAGGQGGIASVMEVFADHGLHRDYAIRTISTHTGGSTARKLWVFLCAYARVAALILTRRIAIIHIHTAWRRSFWRKNLFIYLARWTGQPYIVQVHSGAFVDFYDECSSSSQARIATALRGAAKVLVLTKETQKALAARIGRSDIELFRNPVLIPESVQRDAADDARILFLGSLTEAKGVFELLEATSRIAAQYPELRLVLCGNGDRDLVMSVATRLGIANLVELPGFITGRQKERELQKATLFVLPSHFEALPMSVLEAMAYELPVIATRVGALPEIIDSGHNGILVEVGAIDDLASALARVLSSADERERLASAGYDTVVRDFNADKIVAELVSVYRSLGVQTERVD